MLAIIPRLAGACLALPFACGSASAEELVIGQVAPLSGVLTDTGRDMVLGVRVYFDYVNDHGGIHGRKIRYLVRMRYTPYG